MGFTRKLPIPPSTCELWYYLCLNRPIFRRLGPTGNFHYLKVLTNEDTVKKVAAPPTSPTEPPVTSRWHYRQATEAGFPY